LRFDGFGLQQQRAYSSLEGTTYAIDIKNYDYGTSRNLVWTAVSEILRSAQNLEGE